MKHPSDATLALYAGRDLGWLAQWRVRRHLARCERCRGEAAGYEDARRVLPELSELPGLPWNRLAAEMRANIRLGLEAGECVREDAAPYPWLGMRSMVAYASIAALVFASVLLVERPAPRMAGSSARGVVLQATSGGIEWNDGRQALGLMHRTAGNVTYTAGAQGSMRARYVDSETGYVTINNVYAQ